MPCVRSWGRILEQILHVPLKAALRVLGAGYKGGEVQLGAHVTVTSASPGSILGSWPCFYHRSQLKIKDIRLKVKLERGIWCLELLCCIDHLQNMIQSQPQFCNSVFSVLVYTNDILGLSSGDFSCRSLKNQQENFKLKT